MVCRSRRNEAGARRCLTLGAVGFTLQQRHMLGLGDYLAVLINQLEVLRYYAAVRFSAFALRGELDPHVDFVIGQQWFGKSDIIPAKRAY